MAWCYSSLLENSWPVFIQTVGSVSFSLFSTVWDSCLYFALFIPVFFIFSSVFFLPYLCVLQYGDFLLTFLPVCKSLLLCPVSWWTHLLNSWIFSIHFLVIKFAFDSFSRCRFITWPYLYGTISGFYNLLHHLFVCLSILPSLFFPIYFLVAYKILVPWPGIKLVPSVLDA